MGEGATSLWGYQRCERCHRSVRPSNLRRHQATWSCLNGFKWRMGVTWVAVVRRDLRTHRVWTLLEQLGIHIHGHDYRPPVGKLAWVVGVSEEAYPRVRVLYSWITHESPRDCLDVRRICGSEAWAVLCGGEQSLPEVEYTSRLPYLTREHLDVWASWLERKNIYRQALDVAAALEALSS